MSDLGKPSSPDIFMRALGIANLAVFFFVLANEIHLFKKTDFSWHYFALIIFPSLILFAASLAILFQKKWGVITLFFLYFAQTVSFRDPEVSYCYVLGPHYFLDLTLQFPDGNVVIGINFLALGLLFLMAFGMFRKKRATPN